MRLSRIDIAPASSSNSQLVDAAYPASTAIKIILDNHSAHTSKETKAWLATQPEGRFEFTFTAKHGSWLNLVEAGALCTPAHPSRFQTRARKAYLGRHRRHQPTARCAYLVLQTRKRRLI